MTVSRKYLLILAVIAFGISLNAVEYSKRGYQRRYYNQTDEHKGSHPFGVYWRDAEPQDYIYLAPAHLGATIFMAVGNVVGWPPKIIYNTCSGDFSMEAFLPPVKFSNKYCGPVGAYLLGSPFWCLKKAVWDFPVWIFSDDEPEASTPPEAAPVKADNKTETIPVKTEAKQ
jgi:hypothetical protein